LTAGNADAFSFAWPNPELTKILVTKIMVEVTTSCGNNTTLMDIGTAGNSTTHNDNFLDGIDINATAVYDLKTIRTTDKRRE